MLPRILKEYAKGEDGNFALTFAVGTTIVIGIIGTSIDFGLASNAETRAQQIADAIALNAAIYVKNHNGAPDAEDPNSTGIPEGTHTAASLGYEFSDFVVGGDEGVTVTVDYGDDANREATVVVSGQTKTSFTKVLGKESVGFSTRSIVAYENLQLNDVASIALVLDNSGSMGWDDKRYVQDSTGDWEAPSDAIARIAGLRNSVNFFMSYLTPLVGDQTNDEDKIVRTGMLAYNSNTISSRTRAMDWRLLSATDVNSMTSGGGTNSAPPMNTARTWMASEDGAHQSVNGRDPLKYVVFMTDGVNNNDDSQWVDEDDTGQWRRRRCKRRSYGWSCWYEYDSSDTQPQGTVGYYNNWTRYNFSWTEGRWTRPDDEATLADCSQLKNNGVKIYTIGFALEEGTYGTNNNYWDSNLGAYVEQTTHIDEETTQTAYTFLQNCATSTETFIVAQNAERLTEAFETIGRDILEETIRIKS